MRRLDQHAYPAGPNIPPEVRLSKTPEIGQNKYNKIMVDLNNTLNIKKKNFYDTFKLFDKDKDGLIKREDFAKTLNLMNICSQNEGKQIFEKMKNANNPFMTFNEFQKGLSSYEVRPFTLPKFGMFKSQPDIRRLDEPLAVDNKNFRYSNLNFGHTLHSEDFEPFLILR